eukprot:CAMPEP_0115578428 /NCGR_PEP_ID=MMETSP0272-20121206/3588_1 /TAXON_ID=71861 /ORGANISM="Scrippsiella trochoidea, Strain CCMP3099" /LENGTH=36 /DNA_ID= /DNA_START= /DNA_END= /DNA_ORIENTATION=
MRTSNPSRAIEGARAGDLHCGPKPLNLEFWSKYGGH